MISEAMFHYQIEKDCPKITSLQYKDVNGVELYPERVTYLESHIHTDVQRVPGTVVAENESEEPDILDISYSYKQFSSVCGPEEGKDNHETAHQNNSPHTQCTISTSQLDTATLVSSFSAEFPGRDIYQTPAQTMPITHFANECSSPAQTVTVNNSFNTIPSICTASGDMLNVSSIANSIPVPSLTFASDTTVVPSAMEIDNSTPVHHMTTSLGQNHWKQEQETACSGRSWIILI